MSQIDYEKESPVNDVPNIESQTKPSGGSQGNNISFRATLIAVEDIEVSKAFYCELFDQSVKMDLGWNVTMSGGFVLQQEFAWLCGLPKESVKEKSHNMELYFEVEDFDAFLVKLSAHPETEYVNPPKKHDWQQRVVRIYDPDYHIIEVGESMGVIARRYLREGYSIEETAEIIQHPIDFVTAAASNLV